MKNSILLSFLLLLLFSCQEDKNDIDIEKLNGYWEIVQAQNPYGKSVIYSVNTQVDYFEIEDSIGFRKKMKPDLNGNYTTSKALEKFRCYIENDSIKLNYKTPYDSWTEVILELNDSLMLVINQKDFLYTYKKFEPINVTP
jgi:hypothetical protein